MVTFTLITNVEKFVGVGSVLLFHSLQSNAFDRSKKCIRLNATQKLFLIRTMHIMHLYLYLLDVSVVHLYLSTYTRYCLQATEGQSHPTKCQSLFSIRLAPGWLASSSVYTFFTIRPWLWLRAKSIHCPSVLLFDLPFRYGFMRKCCHCLQVTNRKDCIMLVV